MAAEIVNLRKARKAKARREKAAGAAENRARFGRTKADREVDTAQLELAARRIDGHKRPTPPDE